VRKEETVNFLTKEVKVIKNIISRLNFRSRLGQSTLEYALVIVVAGIISAVLIAVGKPMIIDIISKVFTKIASMV
jgi:Flp pilus assembly pilin Flp